MRWAVICVAALCLPAEVARGWGNAGHEIICAIAWQDTTPAGRALVARLFGSEAAFVHSCTWADDVRGDPRYDWLSAQHYVNIAPRGAFTAARDCPPAGCVVRAVGQQARTVVNQALPESQRGEALKLLAHFVGDLHQPLHVSHAADRGGNTIAVELCAPACKRTNLHAVWDNDLVAAAEPDSDRRAAALRAAIADQDRRSSHSLDLAQWTSETFALAEDRAYRTPPREGDAGGDGVHSADSPVPLSNAYVDAMQPVVDAQLQRAGVRLAAALDALAAGTVPPSWNAVPVFRVQSTGRRAVAVQTSSSPSSTRVGTLPPVESAEVVGVVHDAVRVRLRSGREGYVASDVVTIDATPSAP